MCFALFVLARRSFSWAHAMQKNAWVVVMLLIMLASVLWSDIPYTSLSRWVREVQAFIMASVVLSEPFPRHTMESIFKRTIYVLIPFSVLLIKYFPEYGVAFGRWSGSQMWIGVAQQKNGLGRLASISILFLVWALVKRWKAHETPANKYQTHIDIFILAIAVWLLRGPGGDLFTSATSAYALGAALLVYFGLIVMKRYNLKISMGLLMLMPVVIILFGIITVLMSGASVGFLASSAGRDASLTGRTDIWAELLPVAMQRPILGKGFGGFWTSKTIDLFRISEAHNGYLEAFIGLGILGVLLILAFVLSCCRRSYRELSANFYWGTLFYCYIIMVVVHNIAEASIDSLANHMSAVLLFLYVLSSSASTYDHNKEGDI